MMGAVGAAAEHPFCHHPESKTTREAGGLNFRPSAEKAKARRCFNRCGGYRGFSCNVPPWRDLKTSD
jgi:hypothetical protein